MPRERKRRQYGTGSVVQTHTKDCPPAVQVLNPDTGKARPLRPPHTCRGPWVGRFQAGWTAKGTRNILSVTATTEAECKRRLERRMREVADDPGNVRGGHVTVKTWAQEWLPQLATRARPHYYTAEASNVRRWIVPTVGDRRLDSITPASVRKVTDAVRAGGLTSTHAGNVQGTLERLLKAALAEGHTVSRLALDVPHPGKSVNDRDAIPARHALLLFARALEPEDASGSRWLAALTEPWRPAETLGLTWPLVDIESGWADVAWQLQPLPYNIPRDRSSGFRIPDGYEVRHLVGAYHLVKPKTKSGVRRTPLTPLMQAALIVWRDHCPPNPWGLVWPDGRGMPRDAADDRAAWYAFQEAAGIAPDDERASRATKDKPARYLLYEARHTSATNLLAAGVDDQVIIELMGHSSIVSTRAYQHANLSMMRQALEQANDRLAITAG